ncbi:MAG: 5-methyltetrahydrofolate--homocysteine methyltransferase [Bacteroidaceae bacterium]|nr:5-methyltetrahydrofolate--homocysteine methyltransferase [Bacteroidaceae bacterium]
MTLHYPISAIVSYIDWHYFFHAWGFPPRYSEIAANCGCDECRLRWIDSFPEEERARVIEADHLMSDAIDMLSHVADAYQAHVLFNLYPCYADGDDIMLRNPYDEQQPPARLAMLRQQRPPFLCLADFIGSESTIGIFASSVDGAFEQMYSDTDYYRHMLAQTLADRLAEAATERAHEEIRRRIWGYAPDESLTMSQLHSAKYQGIRPAIGYPSLPDQSLIFDIDRLLHLSTIGISLTENGAMRPHASVCGLMLSHPKATYFSVGKIGEDQLEDYASRRKLTVDYLRPFLS